jgi:regulator of protease activity HflC (stomatin/prohibitin superfamily)
MRRPKITRILMLAALAALPACATVGVTVAPGHAAVLTLDDGSMTVLHEGAVDVPATAQVDDFDLTQQTSGGTFNAVTADGVPLVVHDPVVSYALAPDELVAADRALGPDRWRAIVTPLVHAAIDNVLATYRWAELDSDGIRAAQARITELAAVRLRPYHLVLSAVELKGLTPRLPGLARAVTATSIWEQRAAQARLQVEVTRQRADNLRAQAAGIAAGYDRVAPTLDAAVLAEGAQRAWQQLLTSPAATVLLANEGSPQLEVSP